MAGTSTQAVEDIVVLDTSETPAGMPDPTAQSSDAAIVATPPQEPTASVSPPINAGEEVGRPDVSAHVSDLTGGNIEGQKLLQPKNVQHPSTWRKLLQSGNIKRTESSSGAQPTGAPRGGIKPGLKKQDQAKEEKENASGEKTVETRLIPLSDPSASTNFDLVAVHDITQTVGTAWVYQPEREPSTRPTPDATLDRSNSKRPSRLTKRAQEGVLEMTSALKGAGAGHSSANIDTLPTSGLEFHAEQPVNTNRQHTNISNEKGKQPDIQGPTTPLPSHPTSNNGSRAQSPRQDKLSNWLSDPAMLGGQVGGARVFSFGYKPPDVPPHVLSAVDGAKFNQYLADVTNSLLDKFSKLREESKSGKAPVLFVGIGFGCLIIQKAISQMEERKDVSPGWDNILRKTAGILFVDAPVPLSKTPPKKAEAEKEEHKVDSEQQDVSGTDTKNEDGNPNREKKEITAPKMVFPIATNANSRWVKALLEPRHIDSGQVWETFQSTVVTHELHVVWFFYERTPSSARPYVDGVLFVPLISPAVKPERSITPLFHGPKDANYLRLVDQIRHSLLFKASSDLELEDLLEELINVIPNLTPSARDLQGRWPAHRAALMVNVPAMELLTTNYPDLAGSVDKERRTPLHVTIHEALVSATSLDDDRKQSFRRIIEKLLTTLAQLKLFSDPKDKDGKTPWDYLDPGDNNHLWIRELRDRDRLITAKATQENKVPRLLPPDDSDKLTACKQSKATLIQFYTATDGNSDYIDRQRPTVYQVLYDDSYAPEKLFRRNLQQQDDKRPTCRWIHLPANNEEWVRDLFLRLGRIDESLVGKRHQGTAKYDRHINADVQRYKQIYQPLPKNNADTSPIPSPVFSWGTKLNHQGDLFSNDQAQQIAVADGGERPSIDRNPLSSSSIKSTDPQQAKKAAFCLFMPILGFETHEHRKSLKAAMKSKKAKRLSAHDETTPLIRGYFKDDKFPVHCRRTLDQFTYHMLRDTEKRDNTQVIFKWAQKQDQWERQQRKQPKPEPGSSDENEYPVLMIDQLWLWVLEDDQTVITCFPNTWESDSPYNLMMHFLEGHIVNNDSRQVIECAMDLANEIVRCSIDFLRRKGPMELSLQGCFQSSINAVAESQAVRFEKFQDLVKQLTNRRQMDKHEQAVLTNKLFRLTTETGLLVEILDIQDELKIIHDVLAKQEEVLKKFFPMVPTYAEKRPKEDNNLQPSSSTTSISALAGVLADNKPPPSALSSPGKPKTKANVHFADQGMQRKEGKSRMLAKDNLALIGSSITAVLEMTSYADKMRVELNGLLDLKQKQANAWEARFSREGSESSQRQGNITMVFTIVTIFFLPLSFMASVFAIEVDASPKDPVTGEVSWPVGMIMGLLFGISFAVSIPLAIIAFRVNKISAKLLPWFSWLSSRRSSEAETSTVADGDHDDNEDEEQNDDSDSESTSTTAHTTFTEFLTRRNIWDSSTFAEENVDTYASDLLVRGWRHSQYAPVFGRWHFHEKVPLLRLLWRYRIYASTDQWEEEVERDYPLHRAIWLLRRLRRLLMDPLLRLGPNALRRKVITKRWSKDMERRMRKERREERLQREDLWRRMDPELGARPRFRSRHDDWMYEFR